MKVYLKGGRFSGTWVEVAGGHEVDWPELLPPVRRPSTTEEVVWDDVGWHYADRDCNQTIRMHHYKINGDYGDGTYMAKDMGYTDRQQGDE